MNMIQYTSREKMSPAERITHCHYRVTAPRLYLQSADAANFYGSPTQDNEMAQREQQQGDMLVEIPPLKMINLHARGCRPWFTKVRDTVIIYRDLVEYLQEAARSYDQNPHSGRFTDEMMDFLMQVDNFAEWIFNIAVEHFPNEPLVRKDTLAGFKRRTPIARKTAEEQKKEEFAQRPTEHVRQADSIVERNFARNRSGWL